MTVMPHCTAAFQSTPSAWRETCRKPVKPLVQKDFNPLPPHGGRRLERDRVPLYRHFNPLPPHGGRPLRVRRLVPECISIHSLRMEGDTLTHPRKRHGLFQSTPSAWRETMGSCPIVTLTSYFNPLPPHGGRPHCCCRRNRLDTISIHSLRMEGDDTAFLVAFSVSLFQSTPSAWRETTTTGAQCCPLRIFQSTPSAWRETLMQLHHIWNNHISIHSLRMEGDSKTAQESVFHFAYPCTILQKRMQKTTFCTRKNGFFRKKGEKFGAKPSASFCAPMIRTDTFPLNFSHRISGSSMSMVSFAPICSTFD